MASKETTLKDLAARLNTSISTVSRALQDHYSISAKMKKRVNDLARELNFRPNTFALNLLKNKSFVIGVIVPEIAHNYYSKVLAGIEDAAIKSGYNVMFCVSNESAQRETEVISTLVHGRVDGLLIAPSKETYDYLHFKVFEEKNIPIVFFDRYCEGLNVSKVLINDYRGAYKAVEHLILTRRKRIAHIAGPAGLSNTIKRQSGYIDALKDYGIAFDEHLLIHCNLTKSDATNCVKKLLSLPEAPDAIFTYNSYIAFEGIGTVKNAGLKIPDDIAFVGFANEPIISYIEPQLTAVIPPAYVLGQEAVKLLLKKMDPKTNANSAETIILENEFVVRGSSVKKKA
ncbi:MAG TPA: LacI family DNA-binding transcriptional regulator [Flavihumibacter sp.]|nr:LacI family DNA-binding transcriptional regulator [Flavihumibacter sp.]